VKYPNFCQTIEFRCDEPEELLKLAQEWDDLHATSDVMGYIGTHLFADRADPGRYVIVADFAVVEPGVSAAEEARKNNDRAVTQAWAARLRELSTAEPIYHDYDEIYRTG
jgi:hypothetical protein